MTKEQINKFLYEQCEVFDDSLSLERYIDMICEYLKLCDWHYAENQARELLAEKSSVVKKAYQDKETVGDIAIDIGYVCG